MFASLRTEKECAVMPEPACLPSRCVVPTAACAAGQYRGECEAEADAACLPCNSGQLPKYSRFIASANASACKWSCNVLYHLEDGECVSSISPETLVGAPSLARIKESPV